ncbi:hypothetical protein [Flavobacterium sp. LC2016-01]|uniref:hypothetical protein n=1 Tax=Flavobacterium sp. LC2016-01 TaxID=2675876 RepID=UPI0012BAAD1E|nr:hypothetical protein [Flavobacterium sp. LC2016-01]MTH15181.1 hypothetical protein [Flavobacterium sp. LC2016-01]
MANKTLKFEDFEAEKLTRTEQIIVRGGDGETDPPYDPSKGKGGNGYEVQLALRISIPTISL